MNCPGCRAPMERRAFARRPEGQTDLDLCFDCRAIWFDKLESVALTPSAVLDLFRIINEHRDAPAHPVAGNPRCPSCSAGLQLTQDVIGTNRFAYHRCPKGHGRLTTFFQFLREKKFIRSLTGVEILRLRAHVSQVRCSSCGAAVDVERDAHCGYCRSPLAILDADAVQRTVAELDAREKEWRSRPVDPNAAIEALLAGQRVERTLARIEARTGGLDLVEEALGFLMQNR